MADFTPVEIEQLRLLLQKQNELLSIADDAAALDVVAGAGQETILDLNEETAATLNLADKTVIDKNDGSATKSLAISQLVSFVSGQIGGGGTEFNKQGHFKWVAGGGDGGTGYKLKDIVYHNGNTYISTADNNTTEPGAALASWDVFYQNASTSVKGIVQLQSTVDDTEANAATPKAINRRDVHVSTKPYKNRDRVQNGFGGAWYEAVQDVTAGQALTNNSTFWLPSSNFKIFNSDDVLTTGRALTVNDINKHFVFNNALPQTFPLPLVNSIPSGSVIYVRGGQSIATFNCSGADTINVNNVGAGITSCTCFGSEVIMLVSNGIGDWRLTKINPRFDDGSVFTNVTRPFDTVFTNTSGFTRFVSVVVTLAVGARATLVTGNNYDEFISNTSAMNITAKGIVPAGKTYSLTTSGSVTFQRWTESNVIV